MWIFFGVVDMINKTIVRVHIPHVCVLEAECQRSEWLPAQNVQSSLPPAQFHILCILCGAFPDHRKPNTHAGEHAHLLTTTSSDIISLPHTHTHSYLSLFRLTFAII